jgi:hypothetical protein
MTALEQFSDSTSENCADPTAGKEMLRLPAVSMRALMLCPSTVSIYASFQLPVYCSVAFVPCKGLRGGNSDTRTQPKDVKGNKQRRVKATDAALACEQTVTYACVSAGEHMALSVVRQYVAYDAIDCPAIYTPVERIVCANCECEHSTVQVSSPTRGSRLS